MPRSIRASVVPRLLAAASLAVLALSVLAPSHAQVPQPIPSPKPAPPKVPSEFPPSAPTNLVASQVPLKNCERRVSLQFGCSVGTSAIARYVVLRNGAELTSSPASTACPSGPNTPGSIVASSSVPEGTSTFTLFAEDVKGRKGAVSEKATLVVVTEGTPCVLPGKADTPAFCSSGKCVPSEP